MTERLDGWFEQGRRLRVSAADGPDDWASPMARVGQAAKGVAYAAAGVLVFALALAGEGAAQGREDAIARVVSHDFGQFLIIVVSVALFSFASWSLIRAVTDPEQVGRSLGALGVRAMWIGSAAVHGAVGVGTSLLAQAAAADTGELAAAIASTPMSLPGARWIFGVAAICLSCYGIFCLLTSRGPVIDTRR